MRPHTPIASFNVKFSALSGTLSVSPWYFVASPPKYSKQVAVSFMSNSLSTIGLPQLSVSSSASAARCLRTSAAILKRMRPRICALEESRQSVLSNAARATAMAAPTSFRFASGTTAIGWPVAGLMISRVPAAPTHSLLT